MLNGYVYTAPNGLKGFDANTVVSSKNADRFYAAGYRFAVRYVRRSTTHDYDLTAKEARDIISAGLGLMVVQHVAPEGWSPSSRTGKLYGTTAAHEAESIGIPPGVTVWCDLEGVAPSTRSADVIKYANNWHTAVAMAGYLPGLYVGWRAGLNARQLHDDLRFTHYWSGYNLNADRYPAVRGVQLKQRVATPSDLIAGFSTESLDVDEIQTDRLGGRPTLLAVADWASELANPDFSDVGSGSSTTSR
jgi:hypothetical protein